MSASASARENSGRTRKRAWDMYNKEIEKRCHLSTQFREKIREVHDNLARELFNLAEELISEFSCVVCRGALTKETIKVTLCGHKYCASCMDKIKGQTKPKCAACRAKICE